MSIFDTQEHIAKATLKGTSVLIYGARKIGKTSLSVKYPKSFIIGFEIGWKGLNKVKAVPVKDWNHFKTDFVKPLVKEAKEVALGKKKELTFETLIIDTTDIAYEYCYQYICSQEGVTHLDYTENKRGYKMVKQEFLKQMFALLGAGYTLVFTSHAESKQVVDEITKAKTEKVYPTMDKNAFKIIGGVVDAIVYCANVEVEGTVKRVAYFRTNGGFEAGSRWGEFLPVGVNLDFKEYENAIVEAIKKQAEKDGVDPNCANDDSLYKMAEESRHYDYDEMMEEIKTIGNFLVESENISIMTELSDEMLGVGNKISQCTKLQLEVINDFLTQLKELISEKGLEIPE